MTVGEKIRYYRQSAGLTQKDVADALGTTIQNIFKYEKDIVKNIPLANIETMAALFGIDPAVITGWDNTKEENVPLTNKQQDLLDLIPHLSDAQVDAILALAKSIVRQ